MHGSIVEQSGQITRLLTQFAQGRREAEAELIPLVYDELRRLASSYMRDESPGHTLQTTALVHEAYLRMVHQTPEWRNRGHFFAIAATMMRRVLVDHARSRQAQKRGSGVVASALMLENAPSLLDEPDHLVALDEALLRLAQLDERQCRIVELRFFAGLTIEETAKLLNISTRTVKRHWTLAKAWLYGELTRIPEN